MENNLSFAPLLLVVFLAFLVPITLARVKRLRLPIVVGEIVAGMIVGRSGFNWVNTQDPVLQLLAEFGFVFLMFLSGMEIDFSKIGSLGGTPSQVESRQNHRRINEKIASRIWKPLPLGRSHSARWCAFCASFSCSTPKVTRPTRKARLAMTPTSCGSAMRYREGSGSVPVGLGGQSRGTSPSRQSN